MNTVRSEARFALHVVLFAFGAVAAGCNQKPASGGEPCSGMHMSLAIGGPGGFVPDCANSGPLTFDSTAQITLPGLDQRLVPTIVTTGTSQTVKLVPTASATPGTIPVTVHAVLNPGSMVDYEVDVLLATANLGFTAGFQPASVAPGGTSTLAFNIANPSLLQFTGIAFTANLPSGLQVAASPNKANNGCSGSFSASGSTISLTGAFLPQQTNCSLAVDVTSSNGGNFTVTTGGITSNEQNPGAAASAQLNVSSSSGGSCQILPAPTPPATTLALPAGTELGSYSFGFTLSSSCGSATSFTISQGALPPGTQINSNGSINGGATTVGNFSFTVHATGTNGSASQDCTLAINPARPTLSGRFNPNTVQFGSTTTAQFVLSNNSRSVNLTGLAFTDTLPVGLAPGTPITNGCGGTFSTTGGTLALTGGTLAAQTSCTISLPILANATGSFTNTTGSLSCDQTPSVSGFSAQLTVSSLPSPAFVSAVTPPVVDGTSPSVLSFDIVNANAHALTGLGFVDTLPGGMQVTLTPNATNTCGGTFSAAPNATTISLSGAGIGAGAECTLSVDVSAPGAGQFTNTVRVISSETGLGFTANSTLTSLPTASGNLLSIAIVPSSATVVSGHTIPFTALGTFSSGATVPLTSLQWDTSAPTAATVTTQGVAQGLIASGAPVTITAKSGATGPIGTAMLQVAAHGLVSITITPDNPQLQAGSTRALTATGVFDDGTTQDVTDTASWTSAIPSIATVGNGTHGGQAAAISADSTPTVFTVTDPGTGIAGQAMLLVTQIPVSISVQPPATDGTVNLACSPGGTTTPVVAWTGFRDDGAGGVAFGNASALSTTATLTGRPDGDGSGFYLFCSVENPSTGFRGSNFGLATLATSGNAVTVSISPSRIHGGVADVTLDATASPDMTVNNWALQYGGNVAANDIHDFLSIPLANWNPVFTGGGVAVLTVPAATFASPGAYRAQVTSTSNVDFSVSVSTFYFAVH
jgi:hypothetical protein